MMRRITALLLPVAVAVSSAQGAYVCDKTIDTIGMDGIVAVREFYPDSLGGLFEVGEAPRLKLTLRGNSTNVVQVNYSCDITDIYRNTLRDIASGTLNVQTGEVTHTISIPGQSRFGHYTVTMRISDVFAEDLGYAQSAFIVPRPEPIRRDPFFKADANNGQKRLYPACRRLGFGAIGVKILSPKDILLLSEDRIEGYLEGLAKVKRAGRFANEDFDLSVHVSPAFDTMSYYPGFGDVRDSSHAYVTNRLEQGLYPLTDADLAKIRRFYERASEQLRDCVKVWHLQSEIDSLGRRRRMSGQWIHHLSAYALASRNIAIGVRAGNPEAVIASLGICCGDYFWSPQPFLYSRMILDSMRGDFDAICLDAYTGNYDPTHGALTIPEESLARLLVDGANLSSEYGGRKEVWIGERGLGVDRYSAFDSEVDRRAMEETARAIIIAKAVPECRDYSLHMMSSRGGIYEERKNGWRPKPMLDMCLWRTTNIDASPTNQACEHHTPRAFALAASTCAGLLAFAGNPRSFSLGDHIEVRSFVVPTGGVDIVRIAIWTTDSAIRAEIALPGDGLMTDLAGNDNSIVGGKMSFDVTRAPFFLTFDSSIRERAELAVRNLKVLARDGNSLGMKVEAEFGGFTAAPLELDVVNNIVPRTALMPEHGFFPMKEPPSAKIRFAYTSDGIDAEVTFSGETMHEDCEIQMLRNDEVSAYYGKMREPVRIVLSKTDRVNVFRGKTTWNELRSVPRSGQRFLLKVRLPCRPEGYVGKPPFALMNAEPSQRFDQGVVELLLR